MTKKNTHHLLLELYRVVKSDPKTLVDRDILLNSEARTVFAGLANLHIKDVYCIFIHKHGFLPYIKFAFRENLGCRGVERGLFNHTMFGTLRINIINQDLDWKQILWHLPCAQDLRWESIDPRKRW